MQDYNNLQAKFDQHIAYHGLSFASKEEYEKRQIIFNELD